MGIELNIDWLSLWYNFLYFSSQNPIDIGWQLFIRGGWIVFVIVLMFGIYDIWLDGRQGQYAGKWKWAMLAINIPKEIEQTPKAAENIFTALIGAQSNPNLIDKYWDGKIQESFSFELVSMGGYVQFLIRTPLHFRDLVESAVYAQYPDAEINEVEDYTTNYKKIRFPNKEYNLWGTEFVLTKDYPYPIKTYTEFEHTLSQSLVDPMAGLLEIMSRFSLDEQLWLQLVVTPVPPVWGEKAKEVVKKLMGQEYKAPETWSDKLAKPVGYVSDVAMSFSNELFGPGGEVKKKEEDQWKMFKMSPGEKTILEGVQHKLSMPPLKAKFRLVYLAKNEVFAKGRGVAAVIGALQQFNTAGSNGFKPGKRTKTAADYFRVKQRVSHRQNKILRHFISRTNFYGESADNLFLNAEELASIWHFPVLTVKASLVEKIQNKKTAPPTRLPYQRRGLPPRKQIEVAEKEMPIKREVFRVPTGPTLQDSLPIASETKGTHKTPIKRRASPPPNLPTV
ncbi:MAG: hypothetical protein WC516_01555 [Patescibacteria group bacterium]